MNKRLFLHVGAPKCGSTFLQQALLKNQSWLSDRGINYPHSGQGHPGNGLIALGLRSPDLSDLFKHHHTVVLSHEDLFAAAGKAQLLPAQAAEAGVEVRVYAYLRPFSEFIFGDYSQFIKQHLETFISESCAFDGRSFELFAVDRSRAMAAAGFLKGWATLFADEAFQLSSHKQIRADWTAALNIHDMDWTVPRAQSNPSLTMNDCDNIVQAINAGAPDQDVRAMLHRAMQNCAAPDAGRTADRINWIEALFHKQNAQLIEGFGFDNRLKT
ncbi:hypothetical protein [Actibacterium lipolyticum]|uniref:Sulfotransferase domain-containing protein n=1 Tax=Actibacterium lipolyticum TaxID=1524263 RepID=A0A238KUY7_9RHOB|nr:hypothetical protein [Actibacterium lipolyticum]SMX46421.1 hypothetical protein COL8621_03108 [Actibacterium lipolyticum]